MKPKKRGFLRDIALSLGITYLVLLVIFAIFAPSAGGGWNGPIGTPFLPPGGGHYLGTDALGRDVMARLAFGARLSLIIGFLAQLTSLVLGIAVGLSAGFGASWLRSLLMRFTDAMFSFPDILLAILIVGALQSSNRQGHSIIDQLASSGILPVVVALSITSWPSYSRLVFTMTNSLRDREFVVASEAMGAKKYYLAVKHVLPQMGPVLVAVSMVDLAGFILAESTLSFLGIGVLPPYPSWGSMINSARDDMQSHPLWLLWPCLILSMTIFALNFVGDGLRSALDKRGRQTV